MAADDEVDGSHAKRGFLTSLTRGDVIKRRATKLTQDYFRRPDGPFENSGILTSLSADVAHTDGGSEAGRSGDALQPRPAPTAPGRSPTTEDGPDITERLFKDALRKYESEAKDKYKTNVDPDKLHTFDELLKVVDSAAEHYHEKEDRKDIWGSIRRAFHKLGGAQDTINGWLGLLPRESPYMSVVCGGLMLIIQVAARVKDVSEKVLEGLEKIPMILNCARRFLRLFREAGTLRARSSELYTAVLEALGHILEYLRQRTVPKRILRGTVAFFKQQSWETDLTSKIDNIIAARDEFNREADVCHKEADDASHKGTFEEIRKLQRIVEEANKEKKRAQDAVEEMNTQLREIKPFMEMLVKLIKSNPCLVDAAIRDIEPYADDDEPQLTLNRPHSIVKAFKGKRIPSVPLNYRRELLQRLNYNNDCVNDDLKATFSAGPRFDKQNQDRVSYTIRALKLTNFISVGHSAVLFINGRAPGGGRCSAVGFVAARFVLALHGLATSPSPSPRPPHIVSIHFFCGQHQPHTKWGSPAGVVNNLLAQLAAHCRSADLVDVLALGEFNSGSVRAVFKRFKKALAVGLPVDTTVFCVIDALSTYVADRDLGEDARWLIGALAKLARTKSCKRPILKVLLTAANSHLNVQEVYDMPPYSAVLNLPQGSNLPATGGFRGLKWDFGVRSQTSSSG